MDPAHIPAGSIVVGIDGSLHSDQALAWAADQASLENRPLTIVHAVRPLGFPAAGTFVSTGVDYGALADALLAAGRELLDEARTRVAEDHPGVEVLDVLSSGDARNELVELSRQAAMVVVGSRGLGPVASLLLGSVSVTVSKHASSPVVVCRPHTPLSPPQVGILVGVDGTSLSLPAAELAFRIAAQRHSTLTVLHSCWTPAAVGGQGAGSPAPDLTAQRALVAGSLTGLVEKFPDVAVDLRVEHGFADRHLIEASHDHELVVIGHQPISPLRDLVYGSLAPAVVENAVCTVVVVPSGAGSNDPVRRDASALSAGHVGADPVRARPSVGRTSEEEQ